MKRIYLFISLALLALAAGATTPTTATVDGVLNEYDTDEQLNGTVGTNWHITWDNNYIYFALQGTDIASGLPTRFLHLYIDNDPSTSNGSPTGVNYNTQEPAFIGWEANYHFRWKADNTFTNLMSFTGGAWQDAGAGPGDVDVYQNGDILEGRIARSILGNPTNIRIAGSMINEGAFEEYTFFLTPNQNTEGYDVNYTWFYEFPLIDGVSPNATIYELPVDLIGFEGQAKGRDAHLHWRTATEINNSHFEVLHSSDAERWELAGTVRGQGFSNTEQHYAFVHRDGLRAPKTYYRLRQVDFNGDHALSDILVLESAPGEAADLRVWPNPASDWVNLLAAQEGQLSLLDAQGQRLDTWSLPLPGQGLSVGHLPQGLYYLEWQSPSGRQVLPWLKR